MKGISRIDSGSTHGWFVRCYRNGKTFSKLYSDRKCGGKGKALQQAKDHRDALQERIDKSIPKRSKLKKTKKGLYLNKRETACILAALRTVQSEGFSNMDIATDDGEFEGLSDSEINALCEEINCA